jgi:hypothetical protein
MKVKRNELLRKYRDPCTWRSLMRDAIRVTVWRPCLSFWQLMVLLLSRICYSLFAAHGVSSASFFRSSQLLDARNFASFGLDLFLAVECSWRLQLLYEYRKHFGLIKVWAKHGGTFYRHFQKYRCEHCCQWLRGTPAADLQMCTSCQSRFYCTAQCMRLGAEAHALTCIALRTQKYHSIGSTYRDAKIS